MQKYEAKFFEPEGSTLKGRVMTPEEQATIVTGDRFMEWMAEIGEDYVDQIALSRKDFVLYQGFLLGKYGWRWASAILDEEIGEALAMQAIYTGEDGFDNAAALRFYIDFAAFVDAVGGELKAQTNANLILRLEHYTK